MIDINKKLLLTISTILAVSLLTYLAVSKLNLVGTKNAIVNKPRVVDFFACGDNCPGPAEKYTVKVYEGVKTKEMCDKYGGYFKLFVGWGTTYYCTVEN